MPPMAGSAFRASLSPRDAVSSPVPQFEAPPSDIFRGVDDVKPVVQKKRTRSGKGSARFTSGSDIRIQPTDPGSIPSFQFYLVSCFTCLNDVVRIIGEGLSPKGGLAPLSTGWFGTVCSSCGINFLLFVFLIS